MLKTARRGLTIFSTSLVVSILTNLVKIEDIGFSLHYISGFLGRLALPLREGYLSMKVRLFYDNI